MTMTMETIQFFSNGDHLWKNQNKVKEWEGLGWSHSIWMFQESLPEDVILELRTGKERTIKRVGQKAIPGKEKSTKTL